MRSVRVVSQMFHPREFRTESFVDRKGNQQWIWLAMDRKTREIMGVYIGDHSRQGARGLWNSLPFVYRQCAICYTDFWAFYETFPGKMAEASCDSRLLPSLKREVSKLPPFFKDSFDENVIQKNVTGEWEKRVVKLIVLSALIIPCVNGSLV